MSERICNVPGCGRLGQHYGRYYSNGRPKRRAKCSKHHSMQYGLNNWDYKQYRKDYCENIDGRLGFKCTSTIVDPEWQLDADHINGDSQSHKFLGEEAIQTLCKCCHAIKTRDNQDYLNKDISYVRTDRAKNKAVVSRFFEFE